MPMSDLSTTYPATVRLVAVVQEYECPACGSKMAHLNGPDCDACSELRDAWITAHGEVSS